MPKPVFVTQPTLPPLADLIPLLEQIWSSRILTNMGPLHGRFEAAVAERLGVEHVTLVCNATIGLMLAVSHAVESGAEVITTPFSFIATGNSVLWAGAVPVFADIEPHTLNIDPDQIERHISPQTKAILAVHCYGRPCQTEKIEAIAKAYGIKVIYDAAHAFGVKHRGKGLAAHGDLSVLSFHATKVFNTFEGGAIVAPDRATKIALDRSSNHGIVDETTIPDVGLNGKMSELNAAIGLLQLDHLDDVIRARRERVERYLQMLEGVPGIRCLLSTRMLDESNCYAFPILVEPHFPISRDRLQEKLKERDIYARRYFHPLISAMPKYRHLPSSASSNLPVATAAAAQVLCLPLFPELPAQVQDAIVDTIRTVR